MLIKRVGRFRMGEKREVSGAHKAIHLKPRYPKLEVEL
jgi:hypothetical protein